MTVKKISAGAELTTTSADIYVTPTSFITDVDTMHVCNKTNSTKTVTVQWYDASTATTRNLLNTTDIPAYSYIQLDQPLFLEACDKIVALAIANTAVDLTMRLIEQFTPIRSS